MFAVFCFKLKTTCFCLFLLLRFNLVARQYVIKLEFQYLVLKLFGYLTYDGNVGPAIL